MHFQCSRSQTYYEDDHLENLRANSLLEGEDDAPTDGNHDHEGAKASNQELKDVTLLFGSPQTVVDHHGQTVMQSAFPRVFDPKLGQLCWLLS